MFDFMGIIRAREEFEGRRKDLRDPIFLDPEMFRKPSCLYCGKLYAGSETTCSYCGAMRTR